MRHIDIRWTTADVQRARPDLTENQAWEVLSAIEGEDHKLKVNWDTIGAMATWLYPNEYKI